MLVLVRKVGEEIVIKEKISVRVVRVSGNRAFLAIEAPAKVPIDRKEIWQAKRRERLAASGCEAAAVGPEQTRQDMAGCESDNEPAPIVTSFVRRSIPMPNRVTGEDGSEEDLAKHHDHCRAFQPSVPPGNRPDAPGLRAAVNRLIAVSQACEGPEIELWDDLAVDEELPPRLQSAVLSIVQELLLNACRHSKSQRLFVELALDGDVLRIQVRDWGVGFDSDRTEPGHFGLNGMQQRVKLLNGTATIHSESGKGTCVTVELPLVP